MNRAVKRGMQIQNSVIQNKNTITRKSSNANGSNHYSEKRSNFDEYINSASEGERHDKVKTSPH